MYERSMSRSLELFSPNIKNGGSHTKYHVHFLLISVSTNESWLFKNYRFSNAEILSSHKRYGDRLEAHRSKGPRRTYRKSSGRALLS